MKIIDTLIGLVGALRLKEQHKALSQSGGLYAPEAFTRLYLNDWMARKIVETPAEDMTRRWRAWKADDDQITAIEQVESELQVIDRVRQAIMWARLYGGAVIVIADAAPMETPLNPESIRQGEVIRLLTFSRARVSSLGALNIDPMSEFFGVPENYVIGTRRVHASRVIVFRGAPYIDDRSIDITQQSLTESFWGASVLASSQYAIANAQRAQTAFAALIEEAKIDIISIANLGDKLSTSDDRDRLFRRFELFAEAKNLSGVGILEKDEEIYDQKQVRFQGAQDLIETYLQIIAAAADIPTTRMLGRSPAGMNATGESDTRNYYDAIAAKQNNELTPTLAPLDEIILRRALGNRPEEIWYEWRPLWAPSDEQQTKDAKTKAETTAIYASLGIMMPETLAAAAISQIVDDGLYPGLEQALAEESARREAPPIDPEPDDENADPEREEILRPR